MLAGGPVSWSSKKQKSVALSTMEAEYMALSEAIRESTYIKRLLRFIRCDKYVKNPTIVNCDNQSAILMCKNPVFHNRSKHVDIRFHCAREQVEAGNIEVKYISSDKMCVCVCVCVCVYVCVCVCVCVTADIFTKALLKSKHENCMRLLNLSNNVMLYSYF